MNTTYLTPENQLKVQAICAGLDHALTNAQDLAGSVRTRELSLVLTKTEEAQMWLDKFMKSARFAQ